MPEESYALDSQKICCRKYRSERTDWSVVSCHLLNHSLALHKPQGSCSFVELMKFIRYKQTGVAKCNLHGISRQISPNSTFHAHFDYKLQYLRPANFILIYIQAENPPTLLTVLVNEYKTIKIYMALPLLV